MLQYRNITRQARSASDFFNYFSAAIAMPRALSFPLGTGILFYKLRKNRLQWFPRGVYSKSYEKHLFPQRYRDVLFRSQSWRPLHSVLANDRGIHAKHQPHAFRVATRGGQVRQGARVANAMPRAEFAARGTEIVFEKIEKYLLTAGASRSRFPLPTVNSAAAKF